MRIPQKPRARNIFEKRDLRQCSRALRHAIAGVESAQDNLRDSVLTSSIGPAKLVAARHSLVKAAEYLANVPAQPDSGSSG